MSESQSPGFVAATKIRKEVRKIGAAGVFRYIDG